MDAYSVVLEIKIDGKRVAGGLYELEEIRDDSAWAGEGFGFYDLDPHGRLTPTALASFGDRVEDMTVSVCVVRKSDKKCLHLTTDNGISDYGEEMDTILFDQEYSCSSFSNVDKDYEENYPATHDFRLYGADWDEERSIMRGFTDPHGELRLWDPARAETDEGALPADIILRRWHASKNWV